MTAKHPVRTQAYYEYVEEPIAIAIAQHPVRTTKVYVAIAKHPERIAKHPVREHPRGT